MSQVRKLLEQPKMEVFKMIYGYARVSTAGQVASDNSLADQQEQLLKAGGQEIVVEEHVKFSL